MEGRDSTDLKAIFKRLHPFTEPAELFEVERAVTSLMAHPGWATIQALLAELRSRGMHELMRGEKPLEAAEYAHKLGFLNGVQTAADAAQSVLTLSAEVREKVEREVSQVG